MKDMINYYYNLDVTRITPIYDSGEQDYMAKYKYYIEADNSRFILKKIDHETDSLNYNVINRLRESRYFLEPIYNVSGEIVTVINNQNFVLLRCNNALDEKICLFDIKTDFYINGCTFDINSWVKMWESKIDSFEKWLCNKEIQYLEYIPLFQYYIGISENALLYLKEIERSSLNASSSNCVIAHRRIGVDTRLYEYYDPTDIIVDHPCRDIAEYIKSGIINRKFDIVSFSEYLERLPFSKWDLNILYARILFPTFFYDYVGEEKQLNELIEMVEYYEKCILEIGELLNNKWNVKILKWTCNKKNQV